MSAFKSPAPSFVFFPPGWLTGDPVPGGKRRAHRAGSGGGTARLPIVWSRHPCAGPFRTAPYGGAAPGRRPGAPGRPRALAEPEGTHVNRPCAHPAGRP